MAQIQEITMANFSKRKSVFQEASNFVKHCMDLLDDTYTDWNQFGQIKEMLAALPLTTGEYGLAKRRLANGLAYAKVGENGAARYELEQLSRDLKPRQTTIIAHYDEGVSRYRSN